MQTTKVITLKKHTYDGKVREPGEIYQAEDRHLPVVFGLGWAEVPAVPKRNEYKRRDLRSEK